ncbi:MAG: WD40/YVTN/BNR-like repeat-containing protein [Pirellulaceae bacterium]
MAVSLEEQSSNTRSLLVGLSPVDENVVWASGVGGVVVRTVDGGENWNAMVVPGADTVQFRDVHGVDAQTAYVLSAGTGSASRVYKTTDGGANWTLQFINDGPGGFFDCMDFWDPLSGMAFSDQVDGEFIIIRTTDGGEHWTRVSVDSVPDASAGEGSFAASGRCVMTVGDSTGYIGTGAGASARLLKTTDRGITWTAYETPIHDGTSTSGISSLSWRSETDGFAFRLELSGRDSTIHNAIRTLDGGLTWSTLTPPQLPDIYGGTHVPGRDPVVLIVVGPKGIDYSADEGTSWSSISKLDHWGIAFANETTGWAVGPGGRISKISVSR